MAPMFSVITPTYNRWDGRLQRCIQSVAKQEFSDLDYEHIVVDDGSTDLTHFLNEYDDMSMVRYIRIERAGRVIARNKGMEAAQGEWILHLDSDDALDPMYLATIAYNIQQQPDAKLWVCGAVVHGMEKDNGIPTVPRWTKLRKAWMPPVDTNGVHTLFTSGKVGTGMFIFHHSCLEKTGLLPSWINFNQIADGIDEYLGVPSGTTGYGAAKKLVGNPFGEDHCLFQKLCLNYRVHIIDACLYVQYIR